MSRAANRQLAILRTLESGRIVTCKELCEKTESSRQTVIRDLLDLSVAYPIETVAGRGGGVRMNPMVRVGIHYLTTAELAYIARVLTAAENPDIEIRDAVLRKIMQQE